MYLESGDLKVMGKGEGEKEMQQYKDVRNQLSLAGYELTSSISPISILTCSDIIKMEIFYTAKVAQKYLESVQLDELAIFLCLSHIKKKSLLQHASL